MNARWDPATVIADVEEQERQLVLSEFTHDDAWDLGSLIVGVARARELPIAVAIDFAGQRVFQAGLPGSTAVNDSWINRKVRTVYDFDESSFLVGRRSEVRGEDPDDVLDTAIYAGHGGGFPLRISDGSHVNLVGAVVISGLPQEDDHALAVECLRLFVQSRREARS